MEELQEYKIFYNKDGWVCERYPYDLAVDNKKRFLILDKDAFYKTLEAELHFAWRVVDGELLHERYEPTPDDEALQILRDKREDICFSIINRGVLWYESLAPQQRQELKQWYNDWLAVTKTKTEPLNPRWLFNLEGSDGTNKN